jgi:hypothetical protein
MSSRSVNRRSLPGRPLALLCIVVACLSIVPGVTFRAQAQPAAAGIELRGNGQPIANGDTTPSSSDDTDLGTVRIGGTLTSIFSVASTGTAGLFLTGEPIVTLTGSPDFSLVTQPSTPIIPGGVAPFIVQFLPTVTGTQTATVSLSSNAPGANPYSFVVQGNGFVGPALRLDLTVGPAGGGCPTEKRIRVAPGSTVTYCYRVINTGTVDFASARLVDSAFGTLLSDADLPLAKDGAYFYIIERTVTLTTTHTATWTAYNPGPADEASASDSALVLAEFEAPAITTGLPPRGALGTPYRFTFAGTGLPAPSFSITAGSLPPGLALDSATGSLAGTPSAVGEYRFTLAANNGVTPSATQELVIMIERFRLHLPALRR